MKVVKLLATIGFPLSVFLYFAAPEIIHILFGPLWIKSIPIFKILALTVGIQIVLSSSGSIFQAANRTDLLFLSGVLGAFFMISGIICGIFIGKSLEFVGYGLIVSFIINFFIVFFILIKIALKSSLLYFIKIFTYPLFISSFMAIFLLLITKYILIGSFFSLLIKIIVSGIIFSLFFLYLDENRKLLQSNFGNYFKNQ